MDIQQRLMIFTVCMAILVAVGFVLRRRKIVPEDDATMVIARLVINVALPAMIFGTLAKVHINPSDFKLPVIVLIIEIMSMFLAYVSGRFLKLPREKMGSLLLVATFGNMSALGVSLIDNVYSHDLSAVGKAVLASEIGNQLLLQTLGIMVAYVFGSRKEDLHYLKIVKEFFFNPPSIAIFLGLVWSFLNLPVDGVFLSPVFLAISKADMMLAGLVGLLIGFTLRKVNVMLFVQLALVVIILHTVFEPFATYGVAKLIGLSTFDTNVIVILMSMPAAALNVAIARKYGCDAELAANLSLISIFFGLGSIYLVSFLL